MVSIARIVEKRIAAQPFLQEALSRGILNYGAVAEEIHSDVELEYGKSVNHAALVMALRRFQEKLEKSELHASVLPVYSNLMVHSDLMEFSFVRNSDTFAALKEFYNLVDLRAGDFFTVTTGIHEITIIGPQKYKDSFLALIARKDRIAIIDDLAALTVTLCEDTTQMVGVIYSITRLLAWEGIPIVEMVSTYGEDTLILKEEYVGRAYYAIKKEIKKKK